MIMDRARPELHLVDRITFEATLVKNTAVEEIRYLQARISHAAWSPFR
ncbi:hypothetical protein [Methylobacterium nigriterrae]